MELKNYETILILTPVLSEEQLEEATHKFRSFLQEKKVTIVHEDKIGLKKLAYPIQHKSTGFYHLFEFKAAPDVISALETEYRRDERIIRFSTFALDKHGVEYNEKKRNGVPTEEKKLKKEEKEAAA
ncbi:MAG: 30S ribosomal protein S6 [Roseivirga sp.]